MVEMTDKIKSRDKTKVNSTGLTQF
jgi:hypothetical protein